METFREYATLHDDMGQRLQRLSDSASARFERSLQTTLTSFFKTSTAATTNKQALSEVGTTNVVSARAIAHTYV